MNEDAVSSPALTTSAATTRPVLRHWPACGDFRVPVVGESFYREAISSVAKNSVDQSCLVFCTATLVLDDANAHDSLAVAVYIADWKVGHLSREQARLFRHSLLHTEDFSPTTCDAVISAGFITEDGDYEYSIELDLSLKKAPRLDGGGPTFPTPVAKSDEPFVIRQSTDEILLAFPFVNLDALDSCARGEGIDKWETRDGEAVVFFAPRGGGGSGRLCSLDKTEDAAILGLMAGHSYLTVYRVDGRALVMRSGNEDDPRFAYRKGSKASVLVLHMGTQDTVPSQLAAQMLQVSQWKLQTSGESRPTLLNLDSEGVGAVAELVRAADVLLSFDVPRHRALLRSFLGTLVDDKLWVCVRSTVPRLTTLGEVESIDDMHLAVRGGHARRGNALQELFSLMDILSAHTGKTARSMTYFSACLTHGRR